MTEKLENSHTLKNTQVTEKSLDTRENRPYKVAAIVSVYASERFMEGLLQDLTSQTLYARGELEIILVDSNSPENEWKILEEFAKNHQHIRAIRTTVRE
ncbi:glycosyltransferase, partial [bacterium]|nr:glycosyltransferase [bacterium]